jgi:hypothetical protein
VRGGVGHAAAAARRAEATPLAREGYEAVELALVAVEPEEAVGEDPAAKKGAELLLDETGRWLLAGSCAGEERFELLANGEVQGGLIRGSGVVGASGTSGVHGAVKRLRGTCLL